MDTNGNISILMFPWVAHGHISPYLELAKKLTKRNFKIFLCSTPANLSSIRQKISDNFSHSLQLVELHLATSPHLPPHYHTTNGLPPHLMPNLFEAVDMAKPNFIDILKTLKPDLLIYDFFQPWAAVAASTLNIPAVHYRICSVTTASFGCHIFKNQGNDFLFSAIYYPDDGNTQNNTFRESKKEKPRSIESIDVSTNIILIKTFKEIEGKYINYLSTLCGKKIVPVGPIAQDYTDEDENSKVIEWLNKKDHSSTVFVSFGSECYLSKQDIEEISHGLELSNVNFIWVVRFPKGEKIRIEEALPEKFVEKVGERGMVVEGWAPQARILGHSSTGGFVSHCGWSSVIESMKFGVPIIAMPMQYDQPANAKLVEEVGVGVEVLKDKNGRFQRKKLAAVIKQVVVEKTGEVIRKKVKMLSDNIREKGEEDIDGVVEELIQLFQKKASFTVFSR